MGGSRCSVPAGAPCNPGAVLPGIHGGAKSQGHARGQPSSTQLLLTFLLYNGVTVFKLSDVRVWLEKIGVRIDRRRVYDAATRLVERGLLERVRRGWYRVRDWAALRAYASTRVAHHSTHTGRGHGVELSTTLVRCNTLQRGWVSPGVSTSSLGSSGGSRCVTLFRWHARARRDWVDVVRLLEVLLQRAVALRVLFGCIERWLKELLRRLGVSAWRIRRLVSRAYRLALRICKCGKRIVGHGVRVNGRLVEPGRVFTLEEIARLFGFERVQLHEAGVEIECCGSCGEMEGLLSEAWELIGGQQVYIPKPGTGSRRGPPLTHYIT